MDQSNGQDNQPLSRKLDGFYHAALLFDERGFVQEIGTLAAAVEQGDLSVLHDRASQIVQAHETAPFILDNLGFGGLKPLQTTDIVAVSPHRNLIVGQWFTIVLSDYLKPCPRYPGYHWRPLFAALERLGWPQEDNEKLFYGEPLGLFFSQESIKHATVITHQDPYWRWVRLLYCTNQGGWLPREECARLLTRLQETEPQLRVLVRDMTDELPRIARESWAGYEDAVAMLTTATGQQQGLYMVILWQWDDEE